MTRGPRRLLPAVVAGLVLVAGFAASLYRVPRGSLAVTGGATRARFATEGVHFRIPVLERTVLLPAAPVKLEEEIDLPGDASAGAATQPVRLWLAPQRAEPAVILTEAPDGDLAAAAGRRLAEGGPGAGAPPRISTETASWIEALLGPLGLVEGSLELGEPRAGGAPAENPLAGLREGYPGARYPVLLAGLDGADWDVIEPLIQNGELPVLRGLKEKGAWGSLRSMQPTLSPLLWTTVATGRTPDEHGIVDFLVNDPVSGREVPISSSFRKVRALWNILTELGQPSLTVGWWATWPAEPVLGSLASDRVAYSLFESGQGPPPRSLAWPDSLSQALPDLILPATDVSLAQVRAIVDVGTADYERARSQLDDPGSWQDPLVHLIRIIASTLTYHRIVLHELSRGQPPLTLVYYQGIDEVSHRFAHYAPPAMRWADPGKVASFAEAVPRFYRFQDELLGELVGAAAGDTVVLVISDHGFAWGDGRPTDVPPDIEGKPGRWHTPEGIIVASGPTVRPGRLPEDPGLLDIAPTVLTLLSLPLSDEMPGEPVAAVTAGGGLQPAEPARIASYESGARHAAPGEAAPGSEADAEILARLTALGYIGGPTGRPQSAPGATMTVTGHLNAGNALLVQRDPRAAEREFRAALDLAPAYVPARLGLAQCLVATGRAEEGYAEIAKGLREGQGLDTEIFMAVARFYLRHGEAQRGAALFEKLSAPGMEAPRLVALGMLLEASGNETAGERALREGLDLDPAQPEGLQEIYGVLTRRGDAEELESLLRRALVARPDHAMAANLLALTLERAGRVDEAIALLEKQLEASPRSVATLANLAGLHLRQGRNARALDLLERAIDVDPGHPESLVNLIVVRGKLEDVEGARQAFRKAGGKSAPPAVLNAMAYALYLNGIPGEARALLESSLEKDPGQEEARRLLSAIDRAAGAPAGGSP